MGALSKVDIAKSLAEEAGISCVYAKELVTFLFDEITLNLSKSYEVKLSGFGNFTLRNKSARPGRNPKTGEAVTVSARRVVLFKAGQKLRARIIEE